MVRHTYLSLSTFSLACEIWGFKDEIFGYSCTPIPLNSIIKLDAPTLVTLTSLDGDIFYIQYCERLENSVGEVCSDQSEGRVGEVITRRTVA